MKEESLPNSFMKRTNILILIISLGIILLVDWASKLATITNLPYMNTYISYPYGGVGVFKDFCFGCGADDTDILILEPGALASGNILCVKVCRLLFLSYSDKPGALWLCLRKDVIFCRILSIITPDII